MADSNEHGQPPRRKDEQKLRNKLGIGIHNFIVIVGSLEGRGFC